MRTYDLAKISEKFQHIIYKNISKSALSLYIVYRESWGSCPSPVCQGHEPDGSLCSESGAVGEPPLPWPVLSLSRFDILQSVGRRPLPHLCRQRSSPSGGDWAAPQRGDEWGRRAQRGGGRGLVEESVLVPRGGADSGVVHAGEPWREEAGVRQVSVQRGGVHGVQP